MIIVSSDKHPIYNNQIQTTALPKWLKAKKYAEVSGYSYEAIRAKCYQGVWAEGLIWKSAPDGHLMINWQAVDAWVECE